MSLENATYINQLDAANPSGSDRLATGDDHIRMLKAALKATFPNITGPMTLDQGFLNGLANAALPPGIITLFSGAAAPQGWAICDGGTYPKADGSGNIVAPDLRGRVAVGTSADHPLNVPFGQASRTVTTEAAGGHTHSISVTLSPAGARPDGETGSHVLTVDEIPSHTHDMPIGPTEGDNTGNVTNGNFGFGVPVSTTAAGGGQGHTHTVPGEPDHNHAVKALIGDAPGHGHTVAVDVTQPSLALNYIIKL